MCTDFSCKEQYRCRSLHVHTPSSSILMLTRASKLWVFEFFTFDIYQKWRMQKFPFIWRKCFRKFQQSNKVEQQQRQQRIETANLLFCN